MREHRSGSPVTLTGGWTRRTRQELLCSCLPCGCLKFSTLWKQRAYLSGRSSSAKGSLLSMRIWGASCLFTLSSCMRV
nr:MAG TPA: hypothetical protein [Caudoviricetes sp.]